jgi:hypothetical protein
VVLYTGNGSTQSITGVGFKPDFVWVKVRSTSGSGPIADSTRGTGKAMYSNLTDADYTFPAGQGVTSFDADGFSVGDDATGNGGYNGSGKTYVAWCWKANAGTTSSNTDGTITSTVQVNSKTKFSVVQYTANAVSGATIGHGLGVEPDLVIVKNLNLSTQSWNTYVKGITTTNAQFLTLNTDAANGNTANPRFIPGNFSSSVFSVGNDNSTNGVSGVDTYIAYCFKSVAGFSKIGSYTGTGSTTNRPIINTGFEPAFVMIKNTTSADDWMIHDNKRNPSNPRDRYLRANTNDQEGQFAEFGLDFLTNGFIVGPTTNGNWNQSGQTYLYIAFASDPSAAPALPDSFANKLYTGNGGTQSIAGLGFSPNLVWLKERGQAANHRWLDTIRGATNAISSSLTAAQFTDATGLTSFDTDGFTLGNNVDYNNNGGTFVAWNWKANANPSINTDGTIQSVVSANQASGFSIVGWTGDGNASSTVGHGLSGTPDFIMLKDLTDVGNWNGAQVGLASNEGIGINSSAGAFTGMGGNGGITYANLSATNFGFATGSSGVDSVNKNGNKYIAYCWKSVAGFSKMESYTGNGGSQSITTGFSPDWLMFKRTDQNGWNWEIADTARGVDVDLAANSSGAEQNQSPANRIQIDANGFTHLTGNYNNISGAKYIYMAYKENPSPVVPAGYMAYLVVAGGGGGGVGYLYSNAAGGAGAGGLRTSFGSTSGGGASAESDLTLAAGTYTITIGAGGQGGYRASSPPLIRQFNGNDSSITGNASITSTGGGYGGAGGQDGGTGDYSGAIGGSGGGGSGFGSGAAGTANQGFAGASSRGGGGGASAAGSGANGGDGLSVAITGSGVAYGGGGGAGAQGSGGGGSAGTGGGGQGSQNSGGVTKDGTANTGGGGGGGRGGSGASGSGTGWYGGGAGGSGVVVLRMRTTDYSGTTTGSPTITTRGEETILTYTGSGTYVHS